MSEGPLTQPIVTETIEVLPTDKMFELGMKALSRTPSWQGIAQYKGVFDLQL